MGLKILMTTMSLDIGGAETHIIELSKKLAEEGHSITVASNGGVYTETLEKYGIKHFSVPLHNKRPKSLLLSYLRLKKLIKKESFDIVHAHARIPAYICGLLQKVLKFRFVTTVHGTYEVTPLLKKISNWGDLTLAVSYDVKKYVIENYAIASDNVTATVNGIDMERFSKKESAFINDEAELEKDSLKIVHVSRMDREVSIVAHKLIAIAEDLSRSGVKAQMLIVGGGTDMESLCTEAEAVNKKLGRKAVILCGARTDVDDILNAADIFVGVSRAALEAMSCEVATVLAGAQGCGGIFSEDALKLSLDTNFCFRGEALPEESSLLRDIKKLCLCTKEERKALGAYGRAVVAEHYSVDRMASDAVKVYKKLSPYKPYKYGDLILSGYYGFGNMGDDSLLQAIVTELKKKDPEIKLTVLSRKPAETEKIYGVKSIQRFDLIKISRHMRHAKLLLNGGGSLLQNSTSTRSLFYYLLIMKMAKKRGLKLMLYASGIGPLYGEKNKERVKTILEKVDVITLREKESYEEVLSLGVKAKNIEVTLDPAFSIEAADKKWIEYLYGESGLAGKKNCFAVSLRSWHNADPEYEEKIAEAVKEIKEKYGLMPVFIPMQREKDLAVCQRLAESCGGRLVEGLSASEMCAFLEDMCFVIGMRLHLLIYAASVGTPIVGLAYDPKIEAFLSSFDVPYFVDIRGFEASHIVSMASEAYEKREEIRKSLINAVKEKRKLSQKDTEYVIELLK